MGQKSFMRFDNHMPELTFLAGKEKSRLNSPLETVHHECSDLETLTWKADPHDYSMVGTHEAHK